MAGDITNGWPDKYGSNAALYAPVENPFPRSAENKINNAAFLVDEEERQRFQQDKLYGFTISELKLLNAISDCSLLPGNLRNDMHRIFDREYQWEIAPSPLFTRQHMYPLPTGLTGIWAASNDIVWTAIKPSLILWTALLYSTKAKVLDSRKDPQDLIDHDLRYASLRSFDLEADHLDYQTRLQKTNSSGLEDMFDALISEKDLQFGFMIDSEDAWNPQEAGLNGFSISGNLKGVIRTFINTKMVVPLFRNDLTHAEKLGAQWFLAITIIHELNHAIWYLDREKQFPADQDEEPYFERQVVAELGWTMEETVFGGVAHAMLFEPLSSQMGYFSWLEKDSITYAAHDLSLILVDPKLSRTQTYSPLNVSYFENIQQSEFWEVHVRHFGLPALDIRTSNVRTVMEYGGLLPTNKVDMSLYFTALDAGYGPTHTAPAPFTAHLESYYLRLQTEISQSGSSMDAEGRKRYTAAWKVVNDNMFLQDVWKKSQSLRDLVDKIFQQLDKLIFSKTPDERIQSLNDILQPLFQARIKHAAEIRTLLDIENSTQRVDIESRIVLLAWNNGTRIFTREIWKIADSELKNSRNSRIVSRYRQEMIELEACRFLLWVEGELVGVDVVSTFENEHKVLDAAYAAVTQGKSDTVKSQLASIVLESSLSLFAEGIATILSSTLNQADFGAVDTGLNLLKAIEDALEVYYDSGEAGSMSAIIKWKKPFQGWKNVGAQIRKMVIGRVTQDNV